MDLADLIATLLQLIGIAAAGGYLAGEATLFEGLRSAADEAQDSAWTCWGVTRGVLDPPDPMDLVGLPPNDPEAKIAARLGVVPFSFGPDPDDPEGEPILLALEPDDPERLMAEALAAPGPLNRAPLWHLLRAKAAEAVTCGVCFGWWAALAGTVWLAIATDGTPWWAWPPVWVAACGIYTRVYLLLNPPPKPAPAHSPT